MKIKKLLIIILILLSTVPILLSHLLIYTEEKTLIHNNIINKLNDILNIMKEDGSIDKLGKNNSGTNKN